MRKIVLTVYARLKKSFRSLFEKQIDQTQIDLALNSEREKKLAEQLTKLESQLRYLNSRLENISQTQEELMTAFVNQTMIYEEILSTLEQQQQQNISSQPSVSSKIERAETSQVIGYIAKDKKQTLN